MPNDRRIAVGSAADMLIHTSDPTQSTDPTQFLTATVAGGQLFTQHALWTSIRVFQRFQRRPDIAAASAALAIFAMQHTTFTD